MQLKKSLITGAIAGVASAAHAQWNVTYLNPPGAVSSAANGVSGTQQVGWAEFNAGLGVPGYHAGYWKGAAATWIDLHPTGATSSQAQAASGSHQVGTVFYFRRDDTIGHASLWAGTADSWVDLHPAGASDSDALDVAGNQQVGYVFHDAAVHAALWNGTPESWVNLNPAGADYSIAYGTSGAQQVGFADGHAGLWSGTANSWVDLHPAGASESYAVATSGAHQVGQTRFASASHAALWSGTAESCVDLNPAGANESSASGVFGAWQVGGVVLDAAGTRASFWSGTAGSWEDLSLALTGSWSATYATGIWSDGSFIYVTGYGTRTEAHLPEALLWTRSVGAPADLIDLTIVTGKLVQGVLDDLVESDDSYVHTRSGFGPTLIDLHKMDMVVRAETTVQNPRALNITIESRIDEPAGTMQVRLKNWNPDQFVTVGSFPLNMTDTPRTLTVNNAANYVNANGEIEVMVRHLVFVPIFAFIFESRIDQVLIEVE